MVIRFAEKNEFPAVLAHYQLCHYNGGLSEDDQVVIAIKDEIIGAVRIATQNNVQILRGMQITLDRQREGIGSLMLKFLDEHLHLKDCYCSHPGTWLIFMG